MQVYTMVPEWPTWDIIISGIVTKSERTHNVNYNIIIYTIFTQSDAEATIYFIARVCVAFIRERRLLILVAAREAILREMHH